MGKIKGKFAPLMDELGEDPRWLMECNDTEKFLYMLILFTIYTTNGTAPEDPSYYKTRYNLGHRKDKIRAAIEQLKVKFPKLTCSNKKLSLLNSVTYKNRVDDKVATEEELDVEVEEEKEVKEKFLISDEKQNQKPKTIEVKPPGPPEKDPDFNAVDTYRRFFDIYPHPPGTKAQSALSDFLAAGFFLKHITDAELESWILDALEKATEGGAPMPRLVDWLKTLETPEEVSRETL